MRLGLISDIHGNRLALDAVLDELEREGVDEFICLGDVAVGPQPAEALERVRELKCPVVMGNWDAAFLGDMPTPKDKIGEQLVEIGKWWASDLSPDDREYMAGFAPTVKLEVGSTPVLFFHGSPRSYDEWIFSTTPDDELRAKYNLSPTEWETQKSIAFEHSNQAAAQEERDRAAREAANKKSTNTHR